MMRDSLNTTKIQNCGIEVQRMSQNNCPTCDKNFWRYLWGKMHIKSENLVISIRCLRQEFYDVIHSLAETAGREVLVPLSPPNCV